MIRRDYILRKIAEFLEVLNRLQTLKRAQDWEQAGSRLKEQCRDLIGLGVIEISRLSETELLARLIQDEPTQVVRDKIFMITRLLQEAGDIAAGEGRNQDAERYYLKGLHLLLYSMSQGDAGEWPEFVPRIEVFLTALKDTPLPLATLAGLMQHFERTGQFARAEDSLHQMLESEPDAARLEEFGTHFYERLRGQSDAALEAGNLPRAEVEAGLAEWRGRTAPPTQ